MQATWTLGQMQDDVSIPALRRAVSDSARLVRFQAAWALAAKLSTNGVKRRAEGFMSCQFQWA